MKRFPNIAGRDTFWIECIFKLQLRKHLSCPLVAKHFSAAPRLPHSTRLWTLRCAIISNCLFSWAELGLVPPNGRAFFVQSIINGIQIHLPFPLMCLPGQQRCWVVDGKEMRLEAMEKKGASLHRGFYEKVKHLWCPSVSGQLAWNGQCVIRSRLTEV